MYVGMLMLVPLVHLRRNFAGELLRRAGLICAVAACCVPAWAADKNGPVMKVSLESLGVPGVSTSFLETGASMLTLHFLDKDHLLVTFGERVLVPRIENDPVDDDDRLVAGEIVELPSGKILAKTEWHMHDHGRYLWSLGHGRFLLRIRDTMYTMAPLANLNTETPFVRAVFPGRKVRPALISVSEDGGLLTLETQLVAKKNSSVIDVSDTVSVRQQTTAVLDFFRLKGDGSSSSPLEVMQVGSVRSPELLRIPLDSDGYLWPVQVANNHWQVTFDDMRGKTGNMGVIESSCLPRLELTGPSEFLAMTCRGGDDRLRMASYGLDGVETWQEDVGDFGAPVFTFAPAAGRFAVSHRTAAPGAPDARAMGGLSTLQAPPQPNSEGQEVRVYQNASGDMLLKLQPFPAFKTAENFDLSDDGMMAAVVKDGGVAIYKLPGLTKKDKEDMAEVAKFSPPPGSGPVTLKLLTGSAPPATTARAKTPPAVQQKTVAEVDGANGGVDPVQKDETDTQATAPRAAPTFLKPGEKPEFGKANPGAVEVQKQ
jgi:hypothetical protein